MWLARIEIMCVLRGRGCAMKLFGWNVWSLLSVIVISQCVAQYSALPAHPVLSGWLGSAGCRLLCSSLVQPGPACHSRVILPAAACPNCPHHHRPPHQHQHLRAPSPPAAFSRQVRGSSTPGQAPGRRMCWRCWRWWRRWRWRWWRWVSLATPLTAADLSCRSLARAGAGWRPAGPKLNSCRAVQFNPVHDAWHLSRVLQFVSACPHCLSLLSIPALRWVISGGGGVSVSGKTSSREWEYKNALLSGWWWCWLSPATQPAGRTVVIQSVSQLVVYVKPC